MRCTLYTPHKSGSKRKSLPCRRTVVSVTNRLLCRVLSRDAAEHDNVGDSVAAQAVFAVDAAGYFSRGIQTGNHRTVGFYDLRLAVDFDAAHRVVYCGHGFQNIKRRFFDREGQTAFIEFGIFTCCDVAVVAVYGRDHLFRIDAEKFRRFFKRIGFYQQFVFVQIIDFGRVVLFQMAFFVSFYSIRI